MCVKATERLHVIWILASLTLLVWGCTGVNRDKAGGTPRADPTVVTLANDNRDPPDQMTAFAAEVKRLSGGSLQIEFVNDWRAGQPQQEVGTIEDVRSSKVDMAWVGARAFEAVGVTSFQALLAPLLVDSYDLQGRVFATGIPDQMLEHVDQVGLTGLGVLPGPLRKVVGISHAFVKPSDFEGQVIGTSGGVLSERTLRGLGAVPKLVPARTSLDGLDALDQQLSAIFANRYFELASFVTGDLNLWPRPLVIVMGTAAFHALAPEQQTVLRTAAANAVGPALAASRAEDAQAGPDLCRADMTVVEASASDVAELQAALAPVYAALNQEPVTKGFLAAIRALKARVGAPAESFACPPAAAGASATATPLDGVYEVTTTFDELKAAGGGYEGEVENYGTFRWVLDRGRFEMTQRNSRSDRWERGTYIVNGDVVQFNVERYGGVAPNGAFEKPGEQFTYTWSLYRDQLTLAASQTGFSPEVFRVKPWTRVG